MGVSESDFTLWVRLRARSTSHAGNSPSLALGDVAQVDDRILPAIYHGQSALFHARPARRRPRVAERIERNPQEAARNL